MTKYIQDLSLGLTFGKLRQWSRAVAAFEEELKYCPENVYAHIYLGETYKEMGKYLEAFLRFQKALASPHFMIWGGSRG